MKQYLEKYAEPEAQFFAGMPFVKPWAAAVVLPACAEDECLPKAIASLERAAEILSGSVLVILILNARAEDEPGIKINGRIFQSFSPASSRLETPYPASYTERTPKLDLLVLDKTFPSHQGVGLARKIGADIAVGLGIGIMHSLDADCTVGEDYFTCVEIPGGEKAGLLESPVSWIHPFEHLHLGDDSSKATAIYDAYLRYFVSGLKFAKSPYAFQTLGSTLVFSREHYTSVRGFPKLQAGEDYYFLSKLAKTGSVIEMKAGRVLIEPRFSMRTPYGTGASSRKIDRSWKSGAEILFPHPDLFRCLKICLAALEDLAEHARTEEFETQVTHACTAQGLPAAKCTEALSRLSVATTLKRVLATRREPKTRRYQIHSWFDALKTLRFIHIVEELGLSPLPFKQALKMAPWS